MPRHFDAIKDEILLLLNKAAEELSFDELSRSLSSFRLPIILIPFECIEQPLDMENCKYTANAYFSMVFGHLSAFVAQYPHLLSKAQLHTEISINRLQYATEVMPVVFQGRDFALIVVEYRVEYAHLLSHQEKFLLTDLVHKTSDFIGLADDIGNFVYINEAGLKLLRMSPTDIHLLNVWDLHDHKELRQILEVGRHEDGSFSWVGQVKIRTHEDKWLVCSMSITSHFSEGQRYYATVVRDMSFLKRLEDQVTQISQKIEATVAQRSEDIIELNIQLLHEIEASERMRFMLQEREKRLATILDTTLDGFFMLDINLRLEQSNRAFKVLIGAMYRDIVGERMVRFVTHACKQDLKDAIDLVMKGQRQIVLLDIQNLGGQVTPCSISLNPYFSDGKLRGLFGFVRPTHPEDLPAIGDFF